MGPIDFNPDKHEYRKEGVLYTSVTTVIKKYCNPFDAQFWAGYKSIRDVVREELGESHWERYKRAAGGWKQVPEYYKKNGHGLHQKIAVRKAQFLNAWDIKGHNARVTGTAVHKWKEKAIVGSKYVPSSSSGEVINLSVSQEKLLILQHFEEDKLYAELIISNDEYRVAGTADRVEKYGKKIYIKDYKTSGKITKEAFDNQKMLYPLNSLPDSNYYHYMMQFSFYGWMLAQQGFEVGGLELQHLLPPRYEDKDMVPYDMEYRPDLVENMLRHFRGKPILIKAQDNPPKVRGGRPEGHFKF